MVKRNIDGEKRKDPPKLPGREEFAPDFSTYGEKRQALKEEYRKHQQNNQEK